MAYGRWRSRRDLDTRILFAYVTCHMLHAAFDTTRLTPDELVVREDVLLRHGADHAAADFEHVIDWVHFLRFKGLDAPAIRGEVERWTRDGVTTVYVGQHARTMPVTLAKAMVEQVLASQRE